MKEDLDRSLIKIMILTFPSFFFSLHFRSPFVCLVLWILMPDKIPGRSTLCMLFFA